MAKDSLTEISMEDLKEIFDDISEDSLTIGIASISKGSTTGSIVDIKVILQYAIEANASSLNIAHNHPSGTSEPSDADRKITKRIYDAGNLVDIKLLDHIIVLPIEGFLSFADAGYIYYEG